LGIDRVQNESVVSVVIWFTCRVYLIVSKICRRVRLPADVCCHFIHCLFGWHASVVHALSNFNLYDDAVHESVDDFDDLSDAISDPTTL